jgi:GalNAc-alpha-(1->4)-GalNAc-alpha-(1->3)-diNAcBac-PP-undecaprenol alpha-1,4-N-acetyl-D-galactosaminyltransferase
VIDTGTMRITLVISSLAAGGAERVLTSMANYWVERAHQVTLITVASADDDFYKHHPGIRRIALGLAGHSPHAVAAGWNNFRRLKRLREAIRTSKPDVILSFIDQANVLTLVASMGLGIPVIVSERIDPRHHYLGPIWAKLRRMLYPHAAAVVMQTDGVRIWAERFLKSHMVHVIPNAVSVSPVLHNGSPDVKRPGGMIAAMGRLEHQKGFDILLKAFARCVRKHSDWSLIILGEGGERNRLEALAVELGITDRVSMTGQMQDPWKVLNGTDLFVLSSRYEGFPNALMEAMACGLAVISTDCPSGPREIIRDGIDGILVPPNDVAALAGAMDRLMADPAERQRLSAHAAEVAERFSTENIMDLWDGLLSHISRGEPLKGPVGSCPRYHQPKTNP